MLSLLSLLLASGTVLRPDTPAWTPLTYPDPSANYTQCNTWPNSTLCDPDHILTDQWRSAINDNINQQVEKLENANILYNDNAPPECYDNSTEGVKIYVILAKRIKTASNTTITNAELIDFGDKLAEKYRLNDLACKNYLLLIGVEEAKQAYTRTGSNLKLPEDLMVRIYNQSENVFKEKNYMEGLNKMIDEIGDQMMDPFKYHTTELPTSEQDSTTIEPTTESMLNSTAEEMEEETTTSTPAPPKVVTPWWMFALMGAAILLTITSLGICFFSRRHAFKRLQMQTVIPLPNSATIKSSCPSEDGSNNERFATVTLPRRRINLESLPRIQNEENYENPEQMQTSTATEEIDEESISIEGSPNQYCSMEELAQITQNMETDVTDRRSVLATEMKSPRQVVSAENPDLYKPYGVLHIDANYMKTDTVVSNISSSSCQSSPQSISTDAPNNNDPNEKSISAF